MKHGLITSVVVFATCVDALKIRNSSAAQVGKPLESYGLDDSVWSGLDDPNVEAHLAANLSAFPLYNSSTSFYDAKSNTSREQIRVQILGQFNTGTNLVQQLLALNFPGQIYGANDAQATVWKHSSLRRLLQESPQYRGQFANMMGVAVIRDPLSWLQSMRKSPYDLKACTMNYNWLSDPCVMPEMCGTYSSNCGIPAHRTPVHFTNIEEYWNFNTQDYQRPSEFGFSKFLVIRYEDVVMHTEDVMAEFARISGLDAPGSFQQMHSPAKSHGASGGRAQALLKMQSKSYLQSYAGGERKAACDRLDVSLMRQKEYHDCDALF